MAEDSVPGVEDIPRLGAWLAGQGILPSSAPPGVRLIAGGRSNLTYLVDPRPVAGPDAPLLVLRRPPLGHVLPTAHDMGREYRVLSALDGTAIPVPRPIILCADPDVIGAPFYVMRHVPGEVLRTEEDGQRVSPGPGRSAVRALRGHAGRDPRRGPGRGRPDRVRPASGLPGAAAGPVAAAVGAVRHPGDARLPGARPAAGGRPARPVRGRDAGARRLPAGQHAGHPGRAPHGRGRSGLGDVHPGRSTGRPGPGPRLLGRAGRR